MKKAFIGVTAVAAFLLLVFAAHGTWAANKAEKPSNAPVSPSMIYVMDFALEAGDIAPETRLLNRPRRAREDPEAKASKLVELLSTSLVDELRNKSLPVSRIYSGRSVPDRGWLVKGQFLEVAEGNRVQRAVVGFGAGATDMRIEVEVTDLAGGNRSPFLVFGTDSESGKAPGAIVMMNPYVAAAKFVLSKKASEKDVKKTARQIADVLINYIEQGGARSN